MTRPLLQWPDPRLRRPAGPVGAITPGIAAIWEEMIEVMEAMPGVGLAAPQLGIPLALAVVDASAERGQAIRMADPVILEASVQMREDEEASPNLPGVRAVIARPRAVRVRFLNAAGAVEERDLVGLWARSLQHQVDHLAGRMFFDHLSRVKRDMILRRARKGR